MNVVKSLAGTIYGLLFVGILIFGASGAGRAAILDIISNTQGNPAHQVAIQEAKCEMQADEIYRTADKENALLPLYVNRCMTVSGYDFVGGVNVDCQQNEMVAVKALSLGQAGGYDMSTDPSCYEKYRPPSFFGS
jgi:hypothetical protein